MKLRQFTAPFLLGAVASAATLTAIEEIRFDASQSIATASGGVLFANLRVRSAQTTIEDYVEGSYLLNTSTGALTLQNAEIFPDVGVLYFGERLFAKDVPASIYMYRVESQPQQYVTDTQYTLNSSNGPFYMDLTAGQSLTFHFAYPREASNFVMTSPSGEQLFDYKVSITGTSGFLVISGVPILKTGKYRLDFVPATGTSANLKMRFLNENRRTTVLGTPGATLSETLRGNSRDYAKMRIPLLANQTALLTITSSGFKGEFKVCNSRGSTSTVAAPGFNGTGWQFTATAADDNYVFYPHPDPLSSNNQLVTFTLAVQNTLSFAAWSDVYGVSSLLKAPCRIPTEMASVISWNTRSGAPRRRAILGRTRHSQRGKIKLLWPVPFRTTSPESPSRHNNPPICSDGRPRHRVSSASPRLEFATK